MPVPSRVLSCFRSARLAAPVMGVCAAVLVTAACSSSGSGTKASATSGSASGSASASTSASASASASADLTSLSASAILAKTHAFVLAAPTMHLVGAGGDATTSLSIDLSYSGQNASGSIVVNKAPLSVITYGAVTYFKVSDAFWKAQAGAQAPQVIAAIKGRWIKTTAADKSFASLAAFATRKGIVDSVLTPTGTVSKGKTSSIKGTSVIALNDSDTSGGAGALFVSTSDARPVQVSDTDGKNALGFDYGTVTIAPVPPASEVIDASALGTA